MTGRGRRPGRQACRVGAGRLRGSAFRAQPGGVPWNNGHCELVKSSNFRTYSKRQCFITPWHNRHLGALSTPRGPTPQTQLSSSDAAPAPETPAASVLQTLAPQQTLAPRPPRLLRARPASCASLSAAAPRAKPSSERSSRAACVFTWRGRGASRQGLRGPQSPSRPLLQQTRLEGPGGHGNHSKPQPWLRP